MTSAVLEVEDLTVEFPTEDGLVQAVRGVCYQLRPGRGRWASSASPARASR